jgi:phosphate transport system substrate-binding protein
MRLAPLIAAASLAAACAGDPPPPSPARESRAHPPTPSLLRLAGTGTMVPLSVDLARRHRERSPLGPRIIVEESIGSGGGVRAALDGVVDLGMVSRPLTSKERRLGLVVVPVARDAVVVAVSSRLPVEGLSSGELRALYAGERRVYPDGTPAVVLLRDRGESANAVLEGAFPGLRASGPAGRGRRTLYSEEAMVEALVSTLGGVGVCSLGVLVSRRSPLRALALDGRVPSAATLADGSWPATRPLMFVARRDRLERARVFLDFVRSEEGRGIVRENGFEPTAMKGP